MNDNKPYYDFSEIDLTNVVRYERRELMGNYYQYLVDVIDTESISCYSWEYPEITKQMILDSDRGLTFEKIIQLIWSCRNTGIPIPEHLKKFSPRKRIPTFIEIDEEDL